nr:hypothetical protein [Shimia biformata]
MVLGGCALLALAACSPQIPDSAAGIDDYWSAGMGRPVASTTASKPLASPVPPARAMSDETVQSLAPPRVLRTDQPQSQTATTTSALPPATTQTAAAATPAGITPATRTTPQTQNGVVQASPSNPAPVLLNNPGISNENDFAAVGERRSIQDDADRLQRNRDAYQVVAATTVPERVESGPNVVAYALETQNPVGTRIYSRITLNAKSRYQKNCAKFPSADQAQMAFLSKGGPQIDRLGLDPDGDGFACAWNPAPFRKAARG